MKFVTPYILQAYLTCPREAWLEYHSLRADQEHEYLVLGRLVHEVSYQRSRKEIFVDRLLKVDFFRGELVAEVKKSSKHKAAARLQLAYYLYYLKHEKGLQLRGILLFPKERRTEVMELTPDLELEVRKILEELKELLAQDKPPPAIKIRYCKTCAFQELCWA